MKPLPSVEQRSPISSLMLTLVAFSICNKHKQLTKAQSRRFRGGRGKGSAAQDPQDDLLLKVCVFVVGK